MRIEGVLKSRWKKQTADLIQISFTRQETYREISRSSRQSCGSDPMAVLQLKSEKIIYLVVEDYNVENLVHPDRKNHQGD